MENGSFDFRRIAIVNRGEAAMRLVRAVQELNDERDADLVSIAFYTTEERGALFVREADEAVCLGSASFVDPRDGSRKNRYLDYGALERALVESRAEAAWVGWGFVSEHAEFGELCRKLGVTFVGPDPEVMRALGDKIGSKRMAEEAGVPLAPWSGGPVETIEDARAIARKLGFPLMVKATAGGGGRGIRRVRSDAELDEAFSSARSEALSGFGDATVFMERLVEGARHIEVQIIGDGRGTTWALGVRDCTVQRRNQKVIEESPSPALDAKQNREICEAAANLAGLAGYRGAGTVEFLYDPVDASFSFMEVNARLQVEHPVTELTTGVDLVKLQLHVASEGRLEGAPPEPRGHAIEVRVNAEDPERGFAPAPGQIDLFRAPGGPGLRIDSGFIEGDRVPAEFDSMLAKVIAFGTDRAEALARLRRALAETKLIVRGGASNRGFLLTLLDRPEVRSGEVDVGWLDRLAAEGDHASKRHADVALVVAAIEAADAELALERARFLATAARGRLRVPREVGVEFELRLRGVRYQTRVMRVGPRSYCIRVDGRRVSADLERLGTFERRVGIGEQTYSVLALTDGPEQLVEVDGIPHRISRDDVGTVRAPSPAVVLQVAVEEGTEVARGDRLVVLEAMKMELPVLSPCAGVVRAVLVSPNVQVDAGTALLQLEPAEVALEGETAERVAFDALVPSAAQEDGATPRCAHVHEELRRLMLGFDFDAEDIRSLAAEREATCREVSASDPELLRGEREILAVFADTHALFEHRTADTDFGEGESRTPEEYLLLFLRSLDPTAAGVSPSFVARLGRALGHYGIDDLTRTPGLEDALLWLCRAHARIADLAGIVVSILERHLDKAEAIGSEGSGDLREVLERIIVATSGSHQAVSDLARAVRYRSFDRPFFDRIQSRAYANAEAELAAAARDDAGRARTTHLRSLVECPHALAPLLTRQIEEASQPLRELSLEVLLRRYYRIRTLEDVRSFTREGRSFASARYDHPDGPRIEAIASHARWEDLDGALAELGAVRAGSDAEHEVVVDLFVWRETGHEDPDATARALEGHLARALEDHSGSWASPRPPRRVVVTVAAPHGGLRMNALQCFAFRPSGPGFEEERSTRGLHPMMGKRLQLWRLSNFEIQRLPSVEDVYLFHGVGRDNPNDERLFAFAEVRDLTPMDDPRGQGFSLPHLEMQYLEALAAIRLFQSHRSSRRRLQWNRVILHVWPPLELAVEEIRALAHRLLPAADGLGLQKTVIRAQIPGGEGGELRESVIQIGSPEGREVVIRFTPVADRPIATVSDYDQRVLRMRRRGMTYPYELIRMITPSADGTRTDFPPGEFQEYDLDEEQRLAAVDRAPGGNVANLVVGVIRNRTTKHPEGMTRVILLGDPSREMGSFAEPECRRIIGAIDLAEQMGVPLEWFPISAGAKIAMDSGTENLDWTADALRRLVEFTQGGGEVNVVVAGINVGGQSYWNAEATMLMHNRGILVMTPDASMVLTGKKALDYSGGVSAEDHQGIGGYDRVMGVNGESQYWARDLGDACRILLRYYDHAYVAPGERFPRRAATNDPVDRDVRSFPYGEEGERPFDTVGEVFSETHNPGRRKPFEIRRVMRAVIDQDHEPLERWADMREAEISVVWDAHLGGIPACMIGLESRPLTRLGFVPADGPEQWTAATLFPLSSKKVARAINAASGSRPVVVLANLSGFDGSPESLRRLQLEYGAEIGRAVVNFDGPIVFCVVGRYHGGAYVVFSRRLNPNLEVAALEGSYASVIGGAPAAAVVFAGEVDRRTRAANRLKELEAEITAAEDDASRSRLRARWHTLYEAVHAEKLGEVAAEFDQIHDVHRAKSVGSLDAIVPPGLLRTFLFESLERGMQRVLDGDAAKPAAGEP